MIGLVQKHGLKVPPVIFRVLLRSFLRISRTLRILSLEFRRSSTVLRTLMFLERVLRESLSEPSIPTQERRRVQFSKEEGLGTENRRVNQMNPEKITPTTSMRRLFLIWLTICVLSAMPVRFLRTSFQIHDSSPATTRDG